LLSPAIPPAGRAGELVERLALSPHPEGGFFREIHRSRDRVRPLGDGFPPSAERDALTTIYFLLPRGAHSRWHRVASDEVWHFYEGAPLELLWVDESLAELRVERLGPVELDGATRPACTVPARCWQAARTTGEYTLVGCTVGPGFDFADFALLDDRPDDAAVLRARFDAVAELG
jgi:uncharacterized protein